MDTAAAYSASILAKPWFLQALGQPLTSTNGTYNDDVFIDFMADTVQKSHLEDFKWAPIHLLSVAVLLREIITIEAYVKSTVAYRVSSAQLYRANLRLYLDGQILRHFEESLKKLIDIVADNWNEDIAALQKRDSRVKDKSGINSVIIKTERELEFDKQLGTAPCQIEFYALKFAEVKKETNRRLNELITPELGIYNANFGALWDENVGTNAKRAYEALPTPKASINNPHITAIFRSFAALLVLKEHLRLEVGVINAMTTVDPAIPNNQVLTREQKVERLWKTRETEFKNIQEKLQKQLEAGATDAYKRTLEKEAKDNIYEGNWGQEIKSVKNKELEGTKENFDNRAQAHAEAHIALLILEKTKERIQARLRETEGYLSSLKIIVEENKGMPLTQMQKIRINTKYAMDLGTSAINLSGSAFTLARTAFNSITDWYLTPNKPGQANGSTGS